MISFFSGPFHNILYECASSIRHVYASFISVRVRNVLYQTLIINSVYGYIDQNTLTASHTSGFGYQRHVIYLDNFFFRSQRQRISFRKLAKYIVSTLILRWLIERLPLPGGLG